MKHFLTFKGAVTPRRRGPPGRSGLGEGPPPARFAGPGPENRVRSLPATPRGLKLLQIRIVDVYRPVHIHCMRYAEIHTVHTLIHRIWG